MKADPPSLKFPPPPGYGGTRWRDKKLKPTRSDQNRVKPSNQQSFREPPMTDGNVDMPQSFATSALQRL
jgi:hypothetical protein